MLKKSLQILAVVAVMLATALSAHAQDVTVVLDEKFAAFTDGSAESPASTDISGYSGKLAKTLSGWSGRKIYEAGEALFIGEGGNLQTTRYNMSTLNGNCRVTLRLKAKADYGEAVALYVSYNQVETFLLENNQWTEVSVVTDRGSSSAYIKLQPMFEGVVVDRILIEQSKSFVMTPDVYQPTNATCTSFTATWKRVTGATGYLLNVYSKAADGSRKYFLKDAEYTTTSAKVEGLTDGVQYFFTVRAKVNDNISEESEEIEVIKAEKMVTAENQKEYYTKLTDTLRKYIEERYGFSAMEMTSSEIIDRLTETQDRQALDELRMLFQTADLVKFAKYSTLINENDMNLVNAIEFINKTKLEAQPDQKPEKPQMTEEQVRTTKTRRMLKASITALLVGAAAILVYVVYAVYMLLI